MQLLKTRRQHTFIMAGIFVFCACVWMSLRALNHPNLTPVQSYGGELPDNVQNVLDRMSTDLMQAHHIITAQSDRLIVASDQQAIQTYSFNFQTIWKNDSPVITGVRAFHFEYRDRKGNLLTRAEKYLSDVETVAYTMRLEVEDKEIMIISRIQPPFHSGEHPHHG
jgi:hypothetical protein